MVRPPRCLGRHGAHPHRDRAARHGIDGWWAQGVTVGYERARGMRALHERPDGFSMSASKTFSVPLERLFAAFVDPDERERWLDGVELCNRTNQPAKSARCDVLPGETRLVDAAAVAHWKTLWKEQLARLAIYLAEVTG
ncbi:MAG: hypothetical protein H0V00_02700 [Chloroflexia bacterium]|nr:hypothetical protein [Chloroflexia bacterium]